MNQTDDESFCDCCTFGNHTSLCTCPDRITKDCCHPQNHFRQHKADRSTTPELVGPREVSLLLEVSASRIWVLAKKPEFPVPVARLGCGPIWLAAEIRTYQATRRRTPGRAKSTGACGT